MSDKEKAKPSKSVMGNLPSTRPTRMARRRDGAPVSGTGKPAAKSAPKAKAAPRPKAAAGTKATTKASGSKPRAVRSGSPSLDAAKKKPRTPKKTPAAEPPKGTELVTTAVQATGELAKIGLTLGSQALKRAARRLPKP